MIRFLALLAACLLLTACEMPIDPVANPEKARATMVGVWKGNGDISAVNEQPSEDFWEITRHKDGRYHLEYLALYHRDKTFERFSEDGQWKLNGKILIENAADGSEFTYNIIKIDANSIEYTIPDEPENNVILDERTRGYKLPEPPADYKPLGDEPESNVIPDEGTQGEKLPEPPVDSKPLGDEPS